MTHRVRLSFELDVELDGLLRVLDALRDIEAPYDVGEETELDPSPPPAYPAYPGVDEDEPIYRNAEWLYDMYVVREMSSQAVADAAGCTQPTILDWLKRHDIPTRPHGGNRRS